MLWNLRHRAFRIGAGAAIALLAGLCCASKEANAGCGNHSYPLHRFEFDAGLASVLSPIAPDSIPTQPADPPKPCNGPSCSQNKATPIHSTSQFEPKIDLRWLCQVEPDGLSESDAHVLEIANPPIHSTHGHTMLVRPPRAIAVQSR